MIFLAKVAKFMSFIYWPSSNAVINYNDLN